MCKSSIDLGRISKILFFSVLKENSEVRRLLLNGEKPDFALEDLGLASWGGDGMHDLEKENDHVHAR